MIVSRRMVAPLALALGLGLAQGAVAQEKKQIFVAEPTHGTGYLPLYVAIANGYFAEEGLDVKVLTIESGAGHTNAVLSGQAFAFIGGPEHNAFAKLKGADLRAVVNVVDRGNVYIMARKGQEPAPGQDIAAYMKGKNIATGFFGGTPNSITRFLLDKWKLDNKTDVVMNEVATPAVLAAVRSGTSVIGVTSEPFITQGKRIGLWGEPVINVPKDMGPYAYSTLNVRLASIQQEPDVVRKFVKGVMRGLKSTYENREGAAAVAKKEFPTMAPEDLQATLDRSFADEIWSKDGSVSPQAWDTARAVVLDAGILKQSVPYEDIADMQFFNALKATN